MTRMSDELSRALGMIDPNGTEGQTHDIEGLEEFTNEPREPAKFELSEHETQVPDLAATDAKLDYVVARNHIYTLLGMTTKALARALQVAEETEHPRAFESFNSLAQTARALTNDLLNAQKVFKEVVKGRPEIAETLTPPVAAVQVNVNNNGNQSSVNVLDMLKEAIRNGEIEPIGD